ncbi:uncharacterized protein BDW43DRAFT_308320 [Aspergillus alliaceus]|uniref:uncharacterized protein n=1 Tax=Petromyces alliaceus TaxID=209559 RepID=UPI0012A777DE|nr:uncharacterized protein BDW43DRAFT_308320 [Aspergillus alliaceus]KAB8236641.1 hypothetical protein BDW43DRAFT_308320 [Aspergillus alliaceus]
MLPPHIIKGDLITAQYGLPPLKILLLLEFLSGKLSVAKFSNSIGTVRNTFHQNEMPRWQCDPFHPLPTNPTVPTNSSPRSIHLGLTGGGGGRLVLVRVGRTDTPPLNRPGASHSAIHPVPDRLAHLDSLDDWIRAYLIHPTQTHREEPGDVGYTEQWEQIRTTVGKLVPTLKDQSRWTDIPYKSWDNTDENLDNPSGTAGKNLFKYDPAHKIGNARRSITRRYRLRTRRRRTIVTSANGNNNYFIVGDLSQYITDGVPTPPLTGSTIEVTAVGDPAENGLLVYLSPDMETSLKSTMDSNCTTKVNTGCYQAVMDVLEGANKVLQSRNLEQRGLEELVIRAGEHVVLVPIKLPPKQLEDSIPIETATAIVVVTDNITPQTTVTVPPEQDKVTGSPAMIRTFASSGNGASAGDVGIELDPAVAAHLQALLAGSNTSNCDLSDEFFNPIRIRQLDLSNIICGVETILADGIGQGGYPDWLLMNPARLPWTEPEVVAAVNTVVRWALNQAASLNPTITETQLHGLAFGAFAISWVYFNNGAIMANNAVPSASLRGGPSATACAQQTALQCGAECGVFAWGASIRLHYGLHGRHKLRHPASAHHDRHDHQDRLRPLTDGGFFRWQRAADRGGVVHESARRPSGLGSADRVSCGEDAHITRINPSVAIILQTL